MEVAGPLEPRAQAPERLRALELPQPATTASLAQPKKSA